MASAQGLGRGGDLGFFLSFLSLEILSSQAHIFRVLDSWNCLDLFLTSGARTQVISAPNIDRIDIFPFYTRSSGGGKQPSADQLVLEMSW